ncbi:hypothetical protein OHA18_25095 [Kribbella sp. NBC_00709]|uniref:hypothetical protein n=1 Tax=Kribbella sp. NBC_00709 TaxID=2975972 RepID=UPI002E29DDF6|nr:hypothetical protein [Kribbella sp. NBC_00709]
MQQFDPNVPPYIEGEITTLQVIDPALNFPPLDRGNHVLDPLQAFTVKVEWTIKGAFAPIWLAALGGNWNVQLHAESLGAGPELLLVEDNTVVASGGVLNYAVDLTVPPGTLPEGNPGGPDSGIYKLVVSVFLNSNLVFGSHGYDMIGFYEGPIIQVEDAR